MTPADLVKLAKSAKSGKKVASGLSAASEAATISNMQQAGALPLPKLINTPQSAALKLAQERAALPVSKGGLGLPKNNTPAQRAKAMGFDIETYHGTDAPNIESFDPKRTKIIEGVFSAFHPRTASLYAEEAANKGRAGLESAPNVMPLLLNSEAHVQMPSFNKEMIDSFRNSGYAGVKRPEAGVAVTFDPAQIRSRFAAFDPFRKDVATATAMGVAAPDLLAKEKENKEKESKEKKSRKSDGGSIHMAEGGEVPKAPSNWTDFLSQHAQEESMRLMGGDTALNPMKDGGSINLDDMIRNAVEKANSRNYASGGAVNIDDLIQKAITLRNQHA